MKCVKKLVAVLLTAVMALTLLTACGGGGGGGGGNPTSKGPFNFSYAELITKTNEKLGETGPKLTIDSSMAGEIDTALTAYQTAYVNAKLNNKTDEEADAAGQAAMGTVANYYLFALGAMKNSDVEQLATMLAADIKGNNNVNNKANLKTVGAYANLGDLTEDEDYDDYYLIYVFVK